MSKEWMWVLFIVHSFEKYEDDGDLHEEGMCIRAEILNQDSVQVGKVEVFIIIFDIRIECTKFSYAQ
jgi:hypothetical protein